MTNHQPIKMSADQIEALIEGQRQLQKQFNAFAETQDQLVFKISGNPLDKDDRGMIGEVKDVSKRVVTLEEKEKKRAWVIAGVLLAAPLIWLLAQKIIDKL